jgi:hypothetical protein
VRVRRRIASIHSRPSRKMPLSRRSCRSKRVRCPWWIQEAARWASQSETEKDDEEQTIEARAVSDDRAFQVPATAFEILEGRFDAHPAGILAQALPSRWSVRDDDPGILLVGLPAGTDLGGDRLVVPKLDGAEPVAPTLRRQLPTGEPGGGPTATCRSTGVVSRQPEDIAPVALPAELDQRMADKSTVSEECAVSGSQERDDPIQERRDEVPLALVPRVMYRRHLPAHGQET